MYFLKHFIMKLEAKVKKVSNTGQFECWDGRPTPINESDKLKQCQRIASNVMAKNAADDPTGGADHYNNPDKEGYPGWTNNCNKLKKIGNHQFYKSK